VQIDVGRAVGGDFVQIKVPDEYAGAFAGD
jgi:hypothetical protein